MSPVLRWPVLGTSCSRMSAWWYGMPMCSAEKATAYLVSAADAQPTRSVPRVSEFVQTPIRSGIADAELTPVRSSMPTSGHHWCDGDSHTTHRAQCGILRSDIFSLVAMLDISLAFISTRFEDGHRPTKGVCMLALCRAVALAFVVVLIGRTFSAGQKSNLSRKDPIGAKNDAIPGTGGASTRSGWQLVWSDEFEGNRLDAAKWNVVVR